MKKNLRNRESSQDQKSYKQMVLRVGDLVRENLEDLLVAVGLEELRKMLEGERTLLCGPRYQHCTDRKATRAGHVVSSLPLGGRRIAVRRPRVVDEAGREIPLETWQGLAAADALTERAFEQMMVGVATRQYRRSLDALPADVPESGTSRSAVSRRFVEATKARLVNLIERDLQQWDIVAVYLDGIHFREHVVLVALGVDVEGRKHILGLHEGATENERACTSFLSGMVTRGLRPDRMRLFVIDGARGLRRAVENVFGQYALVQRCQFHKVRNVISHLPKRMHAAARRALHQAYKSANVETARRLLQNLARSYQEDHPSAAASIREGLDETLTTRRLGLPHRLERSFSTTNPLESVNDRLRFITHRVKRWRGGTMILRWITAAALEAETRFRRVQGAVHMPKLVKALSERDPALLANQRAA
jgi:putative transposase